MVGEQHLPARHTGLGLATQVQHDLEELARIRALVQRAGEVWRQRPRQELDLFRPMCGLRAPGAIWALDFWSAQPNDGTSPFSRTGTRTASSLTKSSCVNSMLNPRPRRASIMWES